MSDTAPLISAVTVCYNAAATIAETLDSVRSQTWRAVESVVVDGLSTDGTQEIIARYSDITSAVISESDEGIYYAMNKGISLARGDVLYFLNADDSLVDPEVLTDIAQVFMAMPSIDLVFGDAVYCTPKGRYLRRYRHIDSRSLLHSDLCHQVVFARRSVFERFGIFDNRYHINADYDWLLRVFRGGTKFRYLPRPIANFRTGGASSRDLQKMRAERQRVRMTYISHRRYLTANLTYRIIRRARIILGQSEFVPFEQGANCEN